MPKIILTILIIITILNIRELSLQIILHQNHRESMKLHNLGDQFKGLEEILKGQRTVGYYTDKNIEESLVVAQYEQAQYVLAPTVLKINDLSYPMAIFDCTSPAVAIAKMQAEGFKPIMANNTGIIVAVRQ